jgi:ferredoxin
MVSLVGTQRRIDMTYIVTQLCQGCKDPSCVEVCPVSCFYEVTKPSAEMPDQLYISPDECIDCGACEPECPWEAICEDDATPAALKGALELNRKSDEQRALFKAAEHHKKAQPSTDQVAENKRKYRVE